MKFKTIQDIRQQRIAKLSEKPYGKLTHGEKIELMYDRYEKHQPLTYEEFVIVADVTNDELSFLHDDIEYQICYESADVVYMCATSYKDHPEKLLRCEKFASLIELFDKFRIDGKRIRDIWDNVVL